MSIMCGGPWHNSVHRVTHSDHHWVSKSCQKQAKWRQIADQASSHVPTSHPGPGEYMGCYQGECSCIEVTAHTSDHPDRDLPDQHTAISHTDSSKMTPAVCARICRGHSFYGLQNHHECRCGGSSWLPRYGKRPNADCNNACQGNPKLM